MRSWPLTDAQARLPELVDACLSEGPQVLTRQGVDAVVMVPLSAWRPVPARPGKGMKALLLDDRARTDALVPLRGAARRRAAAPD